MLNHVVPSVQQLLGSSLPFHRWSAAVHSSHFRYLDVDSFFVVRRQHAPNKHYTYVAFNIPHAKFRGGCANEVSASESVSEHCTLRVQMEVMLSTTNNSLPHARGDRDSGGVEWTIRKHTHTDVSYRTATASTRMTLLNDAGWIRSARQAAVLIARTPSLKLYHVIDLVRLMDELVQKRELNPSRPEIMGIAIAAILRPFVSEFYPISPRVVKHHADLISGASKSIIAAGSLFYKRWVLSKMAKEDSTLPAYYNPYFKGKRSLVEVVQELPSDGYPFFYFGESSHCFRPRLNTIPASMPRVLRLQLSDFIGHILSQYDPLESYARIVELQRWKYKAGLQHQFILLHCIVDVRNAQLSSLRAGVSIPPLDFWLRIERSARIHNPKALKSFSTFPPDDKACKPFNIA
ncbi:hypothetical protein DL93DRAFT_1979459 [Clavulina sp. PMI_390]|nr:hypothetical protein DL93DRAFT_1979459 [Clavulina sp. PMI_390]